MTFYSSTKETPYFLAFRLEAIVLIEISLPNHLIAHFSLKDNDDNL